MVQVIDDNKISTSGRWLKFKIFFFTYFAIFFSFDPDKKKYFVFIFNIYLRFAQVENEKQTDKLFCVSGDARRRLIFDKARKIFRRFFVLCDWAHTCIGQWNFEFRVQKQTKHWNLTRGKRIKNCICIAS